MTTTMLTKAEAKEFLTQQGAYNFDESVPCVLGFVTPNALSGCLTWVTKRVDGVDVTTAVEFVEGEFVGEHHCLDDLQEAWLEGADDNF